MVGVRQRRAAKKFRRRSALEYQLNRNYSAEIASDSCKHNFGVRSTHRANFIRIDRSQFQIDDFPHLASSFRARFFLARRLIKPVKRERGTRNRNARSLAKFKLRASRSRNLILTIRRENVTFTRVRVNVIESSASVRFFSSRYTVKQFVRKFFYQTN